MNPNTVEESIKEAQLVVVVCSEVMRKAFRDALYKTLMYRGICGSST